MQKPAYVLKVFSRRVVQLIKHKCFPLHNSDFENLNYQISDMHHRSLFHMADDTSTSSQ